MKQYLYPKAIFCSILLFCFVLVANSQYPGSCSIVGSRTNGNGQSNSCPNVSATPFASNFASTSYAIVPGGAKTGTLVFRYIIAVAATLKPYAITAVWSTNPTTLPISVNFGPASVPVQVGADAEVTYCFYGTNLPSAGTLSFRFTNPETGTHFNICSFAANCSSNCGIVTNPSGLTLPVLLLPLKSIFRNGAVQLLWSTTQENNNKGFAIEKSVDSRTYTSIGFIYSKNSFSNNPTDYSFTDFYSGENKKYWYRLRQEDLDGKFSYSAVISVKPLIVKDNFIVYSDNGSIYIYNTGNDRKNFMLNVLDVIGRSVFKETMTANQNSKNITGLAKGSYFVHVAGYNSAALVFPVLVK